jgi:Tol biopolymer transport system component
MSCEVSRARGILQPRNGLIAIALMLVIGLAGVACRSPESDHTAESRIAFVIELDDALRLVTASADGTGELTVLRDTVDSTFAWSPDGEKIAFADLDGVSVMNADGTGTRQVVEGPSFPDSFAWSPDGGQLAIQETGDQLYTVDADGTNRRLAVRGGWDATPVWSPDGRKIAYESYSASTGPQLHLINSDGTRQQALARGEAASWSPDGKHIAFQRTPWPPYYMTRDGERTHPSSVYVIDSDGRGERRLGRGERIEWSPDGRRIAFARDGVVYVIDHDGRRERRIGRGDYLSWSPSGSQVAVRRDSTDPEDSWPPETAIWVMNVDGSGEHRIWPRRGLCGCGSPAWQPD